MFYAWSIVGNILAAIVCPYALWRGGDLERWAAGIYLVAWPACYLLQLHGGEGSGLIVFWIDVAVMLAYVGLSIRSRAIWTIFLAAFQVNTVLSHIVFFVSDKLTVVSYVSALGLWGGYGLILALATRMVLLERDRRRASQRMGDLRA